MIQLNLLPDVKLEYIRAQHSRRLVFTVSIIVGAAAIALLAILLSVDGLQKKHLNDLNRDIGSESSKLQNEPQIGKILTVQNQLESLTALHAAKPAASRLFDNYLNQVTPAQVNISSLNFDFVKQTATITGTADALSSINKYVDTLKYTNYTVSGNTTANPAFSNVVLSAFSLNTSSTNTTSNNSSQAANYTVTLSYDKTIFDITKAVTLSVPNLIATRSQINQPGDLFKAPATTPATSGGSH